MAVLRTGVGEPEPTRVHRDGFAGQAGGPAFVQPFVGQRVSVAENPVKMHDLHATMCHLLGVDHKRLTFKYQGRHFRLTDVHGDVVKPLLA